MYLANQSSQPNAYKTSHSVMVELFSTPALILSEAPVPCPYPIIPLSQLFEHFFGFGDLPLLDETVCKVFEGMRDRQRCILGQRIGRMGYFGPSLYLGDASSRASGVREYDGKKRR